MNKPPVQAHRARISGAQRRRAKRRLRRIRGEVDGGSLGASALSCAWNPTFTRRDLIDIRRAVRGGWVTSPEMRAAIVRRVEQTLMAANGCARVEIAAALAVIDMSAADQRERAEARQARKDAQ